MGAELSGALCHAADTVLSANGCAAACAVRAGDARQLKLASPRDLGDLPRPADLAVFEVRAGRALADLGRCGGPVPQPNQTRVRKK